MSEKQFQTKFTKWLQNRWFESSAFELKVARGGRFAMAQVKPHQVMALLAANTGTFGFKIPDAGFQNPFDCFTLAKVSAYVVVHFARKGNNEAVFIPVKEFEHLCDIGIKSITEDQAKAFGNTINLTD